MKIALLALVCLTAFVGNHIGLGTPIAIALILGLAAYGFRLNNVHAKDSMPAIYAYCVTAGAGIALGMAFDLVSNDTAKTLIMAVAAGPNAIFGGLLAGFTHHILRHEKAELSVI